jgi:hypothetical protein
MPTVGHRPSPHCNPADLGALKSSDSGLARNAWPQVCRAFRNVGRDCGVNIACLARLGALR